MIERDIHHQNRRADARQFLGLVVLAIALVSPAAPAFAQQTTAERADEDFEEIIVTARRREELNQDVPIAITAFSNGEIREQHIDSNQDLLGLVPSLTITTNNQNRGSEAFTLRGQGVTFQSAQAVPIYLAEAPVISGTFFSGQGGPGQFLDLTNLQVLRGPQGTLFGRNTTGGAVLLEPARPTEALGGYLQTQFGNYDDRQLEGVLNLPLLDERLTTRAAFRLVERDGFTENLIGEDLDAEDYWTARLGVTFRPTRSIENYLMISYGDRDTTGTSSVVSAVNPLFGLGFLQPIVDAQIARGPRVVEDETNPHERLRTFSVVDILRVELGDNLTLRNIASYSTFRHSIRYNFDGMGVLPVIGEIATYANTEDQYQDNLRQFTEELQLDGRALENRLHYVVGAYFERIDPDGPNEVHGTAAGLGLARTETQFGVRRRSTAIYAQGDFELGGQWFFPEGLIFTAGVRHTWDEYSGFRDAIIAPTAAPALELCDWDTSLTRPDCLMSAAADTEATTWHLGLNYHLQPSTLLYATVSEGYKAGGFNTAAVNLDRLTFAPEYVRTWEFGIKSDFRLGEMPVRFNADVYSSDYTDIQRAAPDVNPTSGAFGAQVVNAASARIDGLELEFAARPFENFEIAGHYAYTDARYEAFDIPAFAQLDCSGAMVGSLAPGASPTADLSCIPFAFAPEHQYGVSVALTLPVDPEIGEVTLRAQYVHQGEVYTGWAALPDSQPGLFLEPVGLLSLSADWRGVFGSRVDAHLFMTNATDETYRIGNSGQYSDLGFQTSVYGNPRMFGLQIRYSFGE